MPRGKAKQDSETLEMALIGFEQKKIEIDEKIRQLRGLLGGKVAKVSTPAPKAEAVTPARKKRTLSPAARKRIAAAQKKRWAEHHKKQAESAK